MRKRGFKEVFFDNYVDIILILIFLYNFKKKVIKEYSIFFKFFSFLNDVKLFYFNYDKYMRVVSLEMNLR